MTRSRRMAQQAMMYFDVALATHDNIRMFRALVGKEIQSENHRSVGRVFEGDYTEIGLSRLHLVEDIFNCRLWRECIFV